MKKLILFLMVMIGAAQAQYMTVTASNCLVDGSGTAIATGTLTVLGTDQNNNPIPYRAGSAFQATTVPIVRTITAGSLASSLQLADPLTTSPTNILYWFRLQDNTSKKITDYKGIILQANDVFTGGHFTQFNICKMNPLPLTPQISYATVSIINNASETITGDLSVQGNRSVIGNDTVGGTLGVTGVTTLGTANITSLSATNSTGSGNYVRAASPTVTGTIGGNPAAPLTGVATNSNAASGIIGEYITSFTGGVSLTSNTPATVTSISLTAGDWDVSGSCLHSLSVSATYERCSINVTAATVSTNPDGTTVLVQTAGGSVMGSSIINTGNVRISLAGTTTYYLSADAVFSGTDSVAATLRARRVR